MDKKFTPAKYEQAIYNFWEKRGLFTAKAPSLKQPFTIILPPPNANADLHLGHAMYVYEDIMIRFEKLRGKETLWLPGADHAGFETQFVYEKNLAKQGKSRLDFDRETLYRNIWEFVVSNKGKMEEQLKRLGFALDWSKKKFTLDKEIVQIVYNTFVRMFNDRLIYRDNRLVNYCTYCGTSFSDLEVKHREQIDPLYYLKYGPLVVATVRPETKFGDTAIAVNPKDKRYRQWVGKTLEINDLIGKSRLPVIADAVIDPKFGSGVAKVTPAHDFVDFELAKRHHLELKTVINKEGRLTQEAGPYAGFTIRKAREAVVADLQKKGILVKVDPDYTHTVSCCYKCGRVLEPLLLPQWYVKIRPLAEAVIKSIKEKQVVFHSKRFERQAIQWLTNFYDWNISRQIVWGIRIPAYQCQTTKKWFASVEAPTRCVICQRDDFVQDEDTFDTWFSSAQWPFATLQSLEGNYFRFFYPTSVMETGYDILPWWVCRMLMIGLYATGKVPFRYVFLHGLVRDKYGQKMSKSKGNVVNPLTMVEKYGADALRAALIFGIREGNDTSLSEEKIIGMRNFANKLWNIARFIYLTEKSFSTNQNTNNTPNLKDLESEIKNITKRYLIAMQKYRFAHAFDLLYHFIWHRLADIYLEQLKPALRDGNIKALESLQMALRQMLIMLHPFMPFVTEAIWQIFYGEKSTILEQKLT